MNIFLVAGLPGAGKTTFSKYLSEKLGIPCYNKDHLKEIIVDSLGYKDRAENRRQSDLAFHLLKYIAGNNMAQGIDFILESNFRRNEGDVLKALLAEHGYTPITVFFDGDMDILFSRFTERIQSGTRHTAHTSAVPKNLDEFRSAVLQFNEFEVGGTRIRVDASRFSEHTYSNIFAMIDGVINKKRLIYQRPEFSMKNEIKAFIEEFLKNGETTVNGCCRLTRFESFDDWLDFQDRVSKSAPYGVDGRLPSTVYVVRRVCDGRMIGIVDIRHYVTNINYQMGHVGLSIAPSERHKGYGTEITAWGIEQAKGFGNNKIVISCGLTNEYSRRMIEKNGLIFEGLFTDDDGSVLRTYSIGAEGHE